MAHCKNLLANYKIFKQKQEKYINHSPKHFYILLIIINILIITFMAIK